MMRRRTKRLILLALLALLMLFGVWYYLAKQQGRTLEPAQYNPNLWMTGYLPAYRHNGREIAWLEKGDYAMLTHLTHAAAMPLPDGNLDTDTNSIQTASRRRAVQVAHAQGRPILLTLLGNYSSFSSAIAPYNQKTFINNILNILDADGYDGVDIDMEPITPDASLDNTDFKLFIYNLHQALQSRHSPLLGRPPLLTAAVTLHDRHIMAALADKFDQINLMAYDMAQPHEGWIPWFDSALDNGGLKFPGFDHEVPAIADWVDAFVQAGVPRRKLGLGISLDVACWQGGETSPGQGVTAPRQSWLKPPQHFKRSYAEMQADGLIPATYQWDGIAQMAWFGVDASDPAQDKFCNFNDAKALAAKVEFARSQGLGGVMLWELALDQRNDLPAGQRRPLRQALQAALGKKAAD